MKYGRNRETALRISYGRPEEISDFIKSINNPTLFNYLVPPNAQITKARWMLIPAALLVAICLALAICRRALGDMVSAIVVLAVIVAIWLLVSIHRRFNNRGVTWIIAVGSLVVIALAANSVTLAQLIKSAGEMNK